VVYRQTGDIEFTAFVVPFKKGRELKLWAGAFKVFIESCRFYKP